MVDLQYLIKLHNNLYGSSFLRETFIDENDCHRELDGQESVDLKLRSMKLREQGSLGLLRPLQETTDLSPPPELLLEVKLVDEKLQT